VIANMHANSDLAKQILLAVVPCIPMEAASAAHHALDTAIFTAKSHWPAQSAKDLAPILGRFE